MSKVGTLPGVEEFTKVAAGWLAERVPPRPHAQDEWGVGSDDVSVFHNLSYEQERKLLDRAMAWQQEKFDAGYGAIGWPAEFGGAGLSVAHERAFARLEAGYSTPDRHETFSVTVGLIAPTVRLLGTPDQQDQFVRRFLRAEELCCQLFSEPGAGSDLAGLSTRAVREGDVWVVNGQKVWSSGAQFAQWGELIARTDPDVQKHAGMTAFLVPMGAPGVEVRPIRQMSGGTSFNEVFFQDVRIPDSLRLGEVGEGWSVALTTLGFERNHSGGGLEAGGSWEQVAALARWLGRTDDAVIRQRLAAAYTRQKVRHWTLARGEAAARDGAAPGPEGSLGKQMWVNELREIGDLAASLLGPRITADTGEWGTYAWIAHLLGAPGYRIAGGSDEVQHNIIAERVLGLPGEPRLDRGPWRDIPR
jgi:alkylation response protein AidB-like acyl-CoA dehydrogenase